MAFQKLSFFKFKPTKNINLINYSNELLNWESDGEKFVINECSYDWMDGYYVFEHTKNETRYNFLEAKVEIIPVKTTSVAKFSISLKDKLIDVWGNKNIVLKLLTTLSIILHNEVIIDNISTDIEDAIYNSFLEKDVSITKVKIEDVIIDDGIIANCSVDLSAYDNYKVILKKYLKNIKQLSFSAFDSDSENKVAFTIFSSGSVVIYKNKEDIEESVLEIIKKICFPKGSEK